MPSGGFLLAPGSVAGVTAATEPGWGCNQLQPRSGAGWQSRAELSREPGAMPRASVSCPLAVLRICRCCVCGQMNSETPTVAPGLGLLFPLKVFGVSSGLLWHVRWDPSPSGEKGASPARDLALVWLEALGYTAEATPMTSPQAFVSAARPWF